MDEKANTKVRRNDRDCLDRAKMAESGPRTVFARTPMTGLPVTCLILVVEMTSLSGLGAKTNIYLNLGSSVSRDGLLYRGGDNLKNCPQP